MSSNQQWMRHFSGVVRCFPRLAFVTQRVYRRLQPRFTVGAVGVLLNEADQVLLVEHVFHPKHPWGLPGGWVDRNEMPQRAVEREFMEETGLNVEATGPLDVWPSRKWRNHINLAFIVVRREMQSTISLSGELLSYQWYSREELPSMLPEHIHVIDLALLSKEHLHDGLRETR